MNLNFKHIKITVTLAAAFFICCSMSTKCNSPGPKTEIKGIVTDGATGKPISNAPLEISSGNEDIHFFSANNDGSFDYKFTPEKFLHYSMTISGSNYNDYVFPYMVRINQGTDTTVNYNLYPGINVTVHLVNNSAHGKTNFALDFSYPLNIGEGVSDLYLYNSKIIIDTVAKFKMPHYTNVNCTSKFYSFDNSTPTTYQEIIKLGGKDTLIVINNP